MAKPIGLQLYSLREQAAKDFPGVLKQVAQMGYVGVEYAGLHNYSAKEIAKIIDELGLKSCSAHVSMPTKENIAQLAEDADILGYKYIITGFGPDNMKTPDDLKRCVDAFAEGAQIAKEAGLQLGMHNHWWEFDKQFDGKTPYEIIMEAVPELFSELDIYWSTHAKADTVEVVKKWGKRIPLLHVKDGDLADQPVHKAVGEGKVAIKDIITSADEETLEWLIVELDSCATDMVEAVAKSVNWLAQTGLGRKS